LIESYELSKRPEIIDDNLKNSVTFINSLGNNFERDSNYYLWRNINIDIVKQFLSGFELYDNLKSAAPQNLLKFIEFKYQNNELQSWNIGLITKQQGVNYKVNEDININLIKRTQSEESTDILYYIKKSHIISPDDEFIDLTNNEKERARQASIRIWREKKGVNSGEPLRLNGDWVRNQIRKPDKVLLLLYFLNPEGAEITDLSKPIVGYAISFPGTDSNDAVTYAVHRQLLQNFDLEDIYESEEEYNDED